MNAEGKSLSGQTGENYYYFYKQHNLKSTRAEWIDIAKGIGIFLVVLCHLTSLFEEQIWNVFIF